MAKRKMKKMPDMKSKRPAKPAIAMKPTKGIDASKPTAPALAAPLTAKKPKKMGGYRERMDSAEL